uniref:Uncharacterized protein n=1 Tax=Agrobacterium tumefaciens TaxID=358 RepID=Q9AL90_AGRTU|nr:unknown [Agrobacterium tumefaciens]
MGAFFRHFCIPGAEGRLRQDGARHVRSLQHLFKPEHDLCDAAHDAGIEIGIPDRQTIEGIRVVDGGVECHEAAHGVAEQNDRQAGMSFTDHDAYRHDIGNDLFRAVLPGEAAERRIRRFGAAVAAMIMGIDLETLFRHDIGKTAVAAGVLDKAVADHQHATGGG